MRIFFRKRRSIIKNQSFIKEFSKIKKQRSSKKKVVASKGALFNKGKDLYYGRAVCFSCHGQQGEGISDLGPPLDKSEWVTGSQKKTCRYYVERIVWFC